LEEKIIDDEDEEDGKKQGFVGLGRRQR